MEENMQNTITEAKNVPRRSSSKLLTLVTGIYLGCVLGNGLAHTMNSIISSNEAQKPQYGPNLKSQWEEYSRRELSELTNYRMLIPLSAITNRQEKPLRVRVTGVDESGLGINVQIDTGDQRKTN